MVLSRPPFPNAPLHGWVVLDKPLGLTSTQALGKVRRLMGGKKVGHGGTLDPLATGILPLAFGEATKLIPHIMDGDKEYEFEVSWGQSRDTDDAEGKVTGTSAIRPTVAALSAILPSFIGLITQMPPAYSAVKINGERAYDIARGGGVPDVKARDVNIYGLRLLGCEGEDKARFWAHCGKGTYVRSLARDMALKLGTCGYISQLRRTRVGGFGVDAAITLDALEALSRQNAVRSALKDIDSALSGIPVLDVMDGEAQRLRTGMGIMIRPQHGDLLDAPVIFARHQGTPIALVEPKAGEFRVTRGFCFGT